MIDGRLGRSAEHASRVKGGAEFLDEGETGLEKVDGETLSLVEDHHGVGDIMDLS